MGAITRMITVSGAGSVGLAFFAGDRFSGFIGSGGYLVWMLRWCDVVWGGEVCGVEWCGVRWVCVGVCGITATPVFKAGQ